MTTIALVCAAGVSGTFLARRLAGPLPDVRFLVTTEVALADVIAAIDAVLVAPQLAHAVDAIREISGARPVAVLPVEAMSPTGAMVAVDVVEDLIQSLPTSEARSTDA